ALSLALVLGCITSVSAQESLLPTYVNGSGEVTVEGFLRFQAGQGTFASPLAEVDFEDDHFLAEFSAAVGVGGGFEIAGSVPFEITGTGEADESGVEFELETAGLGDLTLEGNFLIAPATKDTPNVMAGLVIVLPTGDDDFGVPEIRFNGVLVQDGEEGGLGDGVVKAGLQFGVGQQLAGAYLYALGRIVFSTEKQDQDDLEIDHPDVFSVVGGAMLPLGSNSNLDLRLIAQHVGDEIAEDDLGGESTEEAHLNMLLDARLYFTVGSAATIVLGANAGWVQDHALDEEAELDLEEVFTYGVMLGVHLRLGVPVVGGSRK
ncbi:MAG TPA: hypothetical protein VFB87_09550, partial [Gaiellaceae bacterium]|nr:hypothetical protein [Gaiellaceae bacterium]